MWNIDLSTAHDLSELKPQPPGQVVKDTLVMYIFSPTDPEYERNMRYFVKHGMSESDPLSLHHCGAAVGGQAVP